MSELPFNQPPTPPEDKPAATPKPRPPARPRPLRRPIVTQDTSRRDTLIAIVCGLGVLGLVVFGIVALHGEQGKPSANQLTGTIVEKHDAGETEKEITFGKKGLNSQQTDSGFSFKIHVDSLDRDFDVPVNEGLYRARKVGDKQSFIRPPSEQK